jgi:glucose/arabinose dehydrogenase
MHRLFLRALILACVSAATVGADAFAQLKATLVVGGLSRPVGFVQHPSDPAVQFIVEQGGRIRVLLNGALLPQDFLTLTTAVDSAGERGLLGLAFPPDYATSRRFYVSFTNTAGHSVIARFLRSAGDPLRADPASRFDLEWPGGQRFITQPFSNHNGGHIAFGPDGYLYIGLGDGGSGSDPGHRAQNPLSLLGKMLRIDVSVPDNDSRGYRIPPTNPFVGRTDVLQEIWSLGLRNPWRWSFDYPRAGSTGAILIADVGQGAREEINYEPLGAGGRNYGWRNFEGTLPHVQTEAPFPGPLRAPIFDYDRDAGRSITGGYVYRGTALGLTYRGRYFFADFATSRVWSFALNVDPATREASASALVEHSSELGLGSVSISSFGVDAAGELYTVNYGGSIYRIERAAIGRCGTRALDAHSARWLRAARSVPHTGRRLLSHVGLALASMGQGFQCRSPTRSALPERVWRPVHLVPARRVDDGRQLAHARSGRRGSPRRWCERLQRRRQARCRPAAWCHRRPVAVHHERAIEGRDADHSARLRHAMARCRDRRYQQRWTYRPRLAACNGG